MTGTQEITRFVEWIVVGLLVAAVFFVAFWTTGCGPEPRRESATLENVPGQPAPMTNLKRCYVRSDAERAVSELQDSAQTAVQVADRLRTLANRLRTLRPDMEREAADLETQARVLDERVVAGMSQAASAAGRIYALTLGDGP
jgi:hypothetical protein